MVANLQCGDLSPLCPLPTCRQSRTGFDDLPVVPVVAVERRRVAAFHERHNPVNISKKLMKPFLYHFCTGFCTLSENDHALSSTYEKNCTMRFRRKSH